MTDYRTGTVRSGDVDVFYRHAGTGGKTPVIILHQANYFDSEDWVPVIDLLATDRPVAALDARGFGKSTWSATKDYSHEANTADPVAVIDACMCRQGTWFRAFGLQARKTARGGHIGPGWSVNAVTNQLSPSGRRTP